MAGRRYDIEHPQVWRRFETIMSDGSVKKFKVQDVPEDMFDDVVEFFLNYYAKEEPFCMATGLATDPECREQMSKYWRYTVLPQKLSLVCFEDTETVMEKPEIIGLNLLKHAVKNKYEEMDDEYFPLEKIKVLTIKSLHCEPEKFRELLSEVASEYDVFEMYGLEEYMTEVGLSVHPQYRGMNIGAEILRAWEPLCKAMDIKMAATIFTSPAAYRLAKKVGFELILEIEFEKWINKLNLDFHEEMKTAKVMVKKYN